MLRYLARRVASGLLALVGFLTAMFFGVQALIPGDFVTPLRLGMTEQELADLRAQLGLDQSLWVQYLKWVRALASGELGGSTFGMPVSRLLLDVVPATLFVFVTGLLLAYLIGGWQGRWTAWRPGLRSESMTLAGLGFVTAFPPFLAFVLVTALGPRVSDLRQRFLDDGGRLWFDSDLEPGGVLVDMTVSLLVVLVVLVATSRIARRMWRRRVPASLIGAFAAVLVPLWWWRQGYHVHAFDLVLDAAVPLVAFTLLAYGEFLLIMQTTMVATKHEDFIAAARAKGLSERAIRDRHAAPNAIVPLLSRLAVSIPFLMTGLVIVERSVAWPGLGDFLFRSIEAQDMPVVMGALAVIGVIALVARLALDLIMAVVDPRLRRRQA